MNVQHSSMYNAWYTPVDILRRVRLVLGEIDLDPASDEFGNSRVKAKDYFSESEDALVQPWPGGLSYFVNPPGGKHLNKSMAALFWRKLMAVENLTHAVFIAFSLEQMQTTQDGLGKSILDFPFCVPAKRVRFDTASGRPGEAPSHSNVIVYIPGKLNYKEKFYDIFSDLGKVRL